MDEKKRKQVSVLLAWMLLAIVILAGREATEHVDSRRLIFKNHQNDTSARKNCVVIDAGHGGSDPGKVGINGALEKDVNLAIALRVKSYLEQEDVEVILTRQTDEGLYDADADNKKVQDLKRRIAIIEEVKPDIVVSIHQNSYPQEAVCGSQVFYYEGSKEGQELAEKLQESLILRVDAKNHRRVKANDSYYLLKKTAVPIVIAECGFLSNGREAEKLCTEEYQIKVAWAIHMGILQYLNDGERD